MQIVSDSKVFVTFQWVTWIEAQINIVSTCDLKVWL